MRLVSVNIGRARPIAAKSGRSGIFKRPVQGPVAVGPLGLAGDAIVDTENHGGAEQAVYLFTVEDYAWWQAELGQSLDWGIFGENLTVAGAESGALAVGDRLSFPGGAVIEVNAPRIPCVTLGVRMRDAGFARRFHRARRPGAYARVLTPGPVQAGDAIAVQPFGGPRVTIAELFRDLGARDLPPETVRRRLETPLHSGMRADLLGRAKGA